MLILASTNTRSPQLTADDRSVLEDYPGAFDGHQFYWEHIGPSAQDLLQIRGEAEVKFHLEVELSPNPVDIFLELEQASKWWGFWPDPMQIGSHQPVGDAVSAMLPDDPQGPQSEPHIELATRIKSELVEDGVDLKAEVPYRPSLTPGQVRHIRGVVDFGDSQRRHAEELGLEPPDEYGWVKSEFDVSREEIEDAVAGRGPYAQIEGKRTMNA